MQKPVQTLYLPLAVQELIGGAGLRYAECGTGLKIRLPVLPAVVIVWICVLERVLCHKKSKIKQQPSREFSREGVFRSEAEIAGSIQIYLVSFRYSS